MTEIPCVGAIVVDAQGRILLVRRANPPAKGTWSLPGGRVEPGEPSEVAVLRELAEETGLHGTVGPMVGTVEREAPSGGTYVIRDYLIDVPDPGVLAAGDDASDAAWFTPAEVESLETSPGLVGALREWGVLPAPEAAVTPPA